MAPPICDSLFLPPATANETVVEIAKLYASKAVGPIVVLSLFFNNYRPSSLLVFF